jgi:cytochrome bd-type quinol oxidase subunit 1
MNAQLLTLSRVQFAFTVAFHMTFPAITVGLSVFLVFLYGTYLRTNQEIYLTIYRFWRNIFAVGFGLGVVAGIVLTFEFGLNWAGYANAVGPILGVTISMEVITAFFLEAGFIGILLYGEGRVSKRVTFLATCMVALGTVLSATWILASNSWMQTPAGYTLVNGQFRPSNWIAAIFNPSFLYRFPHLLLGVLLAASFVVTGISAWYLLKRTHLEFACRTFSLGLGVISILFTCSKPVPGLKLAPPALQPPMVFAFYGFHLMFYISILIFCVTACGIWLRLRGRLYMARWFHRFVLLMFPAGIVAVICGWIAAETGRQPYVVFGKLTTAAAVSPLSPGLVVASLIAFILIYLTLLALYIAYLVRTIRRGPADIQQLAPALGILDAPGVISTEGAS